MGRAILVLISMNLLEENGNEIHHMGFYLYFQLGLNWRNHFGFKKKKHYIFVITKTCQ